MKKLKKLGFIWLALLVLNSCISDDDTEIIKQNITVTNARIELDFNESKELKPYEDETARWYLGDSLITESSQYTFKAEKAGEYILSAVRKTNFKVDSLVYTIKVYGEFANGVLLINSTSESGENGEITFINPQDEIIYNAFEKINDTILSDGLISANTLNKEIFILSQTGPNYISSINRETLEHVNNVTSSQASSPAYLNFFKNKGILVNAESEDRSFYFWNTDENQIYSSNLQELTDVPAIQSASLQVNGDLLLVNGNSLYSYNDSSQEIKQIFTGEGYVSGLLPDEKGGFYIATQKTENVNAQFIHYNSNLEEIEKISLPSTFSLPRNGNINFSGENFYWQETSTGELIKYDSYNRKFTNLGSGFLYGIMFTTFIKENPYTNEIFIGGYSDFMTSKGMLVKLKSNGELIKVYDEIGYAPVDIIFNDKSLFK